MSPFGRHAFTECLSLKLNVEKVIEQIPFHVVSNTRDWRIKKQIKMRQKHTPDFDLSLAIAAGSVGSDPLLVRPPDGCSPEVTPLGAPWQCLRIG